MKVLELALKATGRIPSELFGTKKLTQQCIYQTELSRATEMPSLSYKNKRTLFNHTQVHLP